MYERLKELAEKAGKQHGCRLYDIYRHKDKLQILIDKPEKGQYVGVDDCERVFHSLNLLLKMEFPEIVRTKRIEVSSPGVEKKLRQKWHFEISIGEPIYVVTDQRSFKGALKQVSEEGLELIQNDKNWQVNFKDIRKAKSVFVADNLKNNMKRGV